MKKLLLLICLMWGNAAFAHPGHLIEVAGHDHVLAGVAIGAAIGAAIWGALKGKPKEEAAEEDVSDEELQEA
jgi:hypothetical protein